MNNFTTTTQGSQSPVHTPDKKYVFGPYRQEKSYLVGVYVGDSFLITQSQFEDFIRRLTDFPDSVFAEIKPGTYLNINNIAYLDLQV